MNFGKLIKPQNLKKVAEVVKREAAKPENRKRLNDAVAKVRHARKPGPKA